LPCAVTLASAVEVVVIMPRKGGASERLAEEIALAKRIKKAREDAPKKALKERKRGPPWSIGDVSSPDNCAGDDDLEKRVLGALGRGDGFHPVAERLVGALLRLDMPLQLAELARVPEEKRERFLLALFSAVIDVWEHDSSRNMVAALKENEALSRATGVLRVARQALADLDDEYKKLRPRGLAEASVLGRLQEVTSEIEQGMVSFFTLMAEEIAPPRPRVHRRGRRPGTLENPRLRHFLRELRRAANAHGGRLGLQKNLEKGTLLEAIEIVAPHLPAGFVPSACRLQRSGGIAAADLPSNTRPKIGAFLVVYYCIAIIDIVVLRFATLRRSARTRRTADGRHRIPTDDAPPACRICATANRHPVDLFQTDEGRRHRTCAAAHRDLR
jgi:hypothetical protein